MIPVDIHILKTLPLYLEYFLKVVDSHSIQSPFMFGFYNGLVRALGENEKQLDIEAVRQQLHGSDSVVSGIDYGAGSRRSSISISGIAQYGISAEKDCRLLYTLAQMTKAKTIVELGTSVGLATCYLSRVNAKAKIYTFEGNETLVKIANGLFEQMFCENVELIEGNIDETLPARLHLMDQIDMAIIDANHTGEALWNYFSLLKGKMSATGIIVVDDIRWSPDMYKTWKKLISCSDVSISVDFLQCGVVFFQRNLIKQHYILSY